MSLISDVSCLFSSLCRCAALRALPRFHPPAKKRISEVPIPKKTDEMLNFYTKPRQIVIVCPANRQIFNIPDSYLCGPHSLIYSFQESFQVYINLCGQILSLFAKLSLTYSFQDSLPLSVSQYLIQVPGPGRSQPVPWAHVPRHRRRKGFGPGLRSRNTKRFRKGLDETHGEVFSKSTCHRDFRHKWLG